MGLYAYIHIVNISLVFRSSLTTYLLGYHSTLAFDSTYVCEWGEKMDTQFLTCMAKKNVFMLFNLISFETFSEFGEKIDDIAYLKGNVVILIE